MIDDIFLEKTDPSTMSLNIYLKAEEEQTEWAIQVTFSSPVADVHNVKVGRTRASGFYCSVYEPRSSY